MNRNFDYLGNTFQLQLLNQIIVDKEFSNSIMDVMESTYFDNKYFKIIIQMVKEYRSKYESVPNFETLEQIVKSEISQELVAKIVLDTLKQVKDAPFDGTTFVQEKALKFCKQQELQKAMDRAQKIINEGDFESYDKVETLVREALQVGQIESGTNDVFSDLETVLDEDYRNPIPMGISGIDKLLKGGLSKGEIGVILAPTGVGKSLCISEPVLTPTGWTVMGDIKIGDKVIGSDGKEQYVLGVYPQGVRPIYKVEFSDNTFVNCDEEHLWSVNTLNMRTAKTRVKGKGVYKPNYGYKVVKTSDMMNDIKKRGRYNYRLPVVDPVQFENKDVNIDPYLLGLLLGDGSICNSGVRIHTKDEELFDNIKNLEEHTSFVNYQKNDTSTIFDIRFKSKIKERINHYGLLNKKSNNKFIPKEYLYNSLDVRVSLLQGLMDTDGYVDKKGTVQYTTVSEQLSKDVRELVLSLGGTARVTSKIPTYRYNGEKKEGQKAYTITMSFANNIVPFKLLRKVDRYYKRTKYLEHKYVKSITYSHHEEAVCIKVSNPDELYVTRDYVLTHNTTVLTKIANTAFNLGYNVLQIFFEDNPKIIQRKHFTLWTGIEPDNLVQHKEEVMGKISEIQKTMTNKLVLKKLPSDSITMSNIKNQVRKMIADGTKIDMITLDYIDCIVPESTSKDEWKAEGSVMRGFEAMCHELSIAGWTGTQGNRCVSLDTYVDIEGKGIIQIKEVEVGDKILTHDGFKKVSYIFPIEKQPVYKIKTKSGKEIKVSSKHNFPTKKGLKSISIGLSIGDELYVKK
jgi:intein/homing endonuclease